MPWHTHLYYTGGTWGGTLKPSKYALNVIRPTWGGDSNRVLRPSTGPALSDPGTVKLLQDLFPGYDIGRAAGLWVAFPLTDPACVLTAGTARRLAAVIIADEATRS